MFKQKTAYDMRISAWSSDVCSSDLRYHLVGDPGQPGHFRGDRAARVSQRLHAPSHLADTPVCIEGEGQGCELDDGICLRIEPCGFRVEDDAELGFCVGAIAENITRLHPSQDPVVGARGESSGEILEVVVCTHVKLGRASCRERVCQYV